MSESKKCAHKECSCTAKPGEKYCCQHCQAADTAKVHSLKCDCGHPGCTGTL
jgi:hypothetical protein